MPKSPAAPGFQLWIGNDLVITSVCGKWSQNEEESFSRELTDSNRLSPFFQRIYLAIQFCVTLPLWGAVL